jgi:hypothetical protein
VLMGWLLLDLLSAGLYRYAAPLRIQQSARSVLTKPVQLL